MWKYLGSFQGGDTYKACMRSPSERTSFNVKKTNKSVVVGNLLVDMRIYISNESSENKIISTRSL